MSSGSLSSLATESISIPKNTSVDLGPYVLSGSIGVHVLSHACNIKCKLDSHSCIPALPSVIKSSMYMYWSAYVTPRCFMIHNSASAKAETTVVLTAVQIAAFCRRKLFLPNSFPVVCDHLDGPAPFYVLALCV